jgi:adenosine kinase
MTRVYHRPAMGQIAVTGSVAYDTIMVFPGRFAEHILPGKTHLINVSFLVDRIERRRGGTAANIAYTLALLGERPLLCAAVGADYDTDAAELAAFGVDVSAALRCDDISTASGFITTDLDDNQITAFYPGAMSRAAQIDLRTRSDDIDTVVVAPDAPDAMAAHVAQAASLAVRLVFAPAQQIPSLTTETLSAGLEAAWLVVGNDYELELINSRTGITVDDLARRGALVALTRGAQGSQLHSGDAVIHIPAAPPTAVVDPTGAGDAYLAGLLAGLRRGRDLATAGRLGSITAAYAVEQPCTQTHHFTPEQLATRYRQAFDTDLPPT